jgi:hypothetical protein
MWYLWYICDIFFVCLEGIANTNKKGYTGHFAECQGHSTRQGRNTWAPVKLLCRVIRPWHSAKKQAFVECLLEHSAKKLTKGPAGRIVAECYSGGHSTKRETLCWVSPNTLDKDILFAECHLVHSSKAPSPLPAAVTAAFLCRVPSDTVECPIKSTRQKSRCRCTVRCSLFAKYHTRQSLRRVFFGLCRVLQTLGKDADSGSGWWIQYQ